MMRCAQMLVAWCLMGCLVPLLTGCSGLADSTLTGRMWEGAGKSDCSGPAEQPNLSLYQTANRRDILVIYDETQDRTGVIRRRAYLLNANKGRVEAGRGPRFVRVRHMDRLRTIPVESCGLSETDDSIGAGMKAVLLADARHFTVVSDGNEVGSFYLPAYVNHGGLAWRIAATPLTVSGDVAVYTTIAVGVICLEALTHQDDDDNSFELQQHHEEHHKDKDKKEKSK
jgi:hypothetical protein